MRDKSDEDEMHFFTTNLEKVPIVEGLRRDEGWVNMQVQFLIDKATANSGDLLVGKTILPPGARHERHRHSNCEEFWIVLQGSGVMYTNEGERPARQGDVVLIPRGHWHGFRNTTDSDVELIWGWSGAGSLEDSGYEVAHE